MTVNGLAEFCQIVKAARVDRRPHPAAEPV
jgi:hypothetical protein